MGMDISRDIGLTKGIVYEDCTGAKGACGLCPGCNRRVSEILASMVIEARYTRRGRSFPSANAEEQRYARNMVKRLLAMLGLPGGGDPLCPECEKAKEPRCALCLTGAGIRPVGSGEAAQDVAGPSASRQGDRSARYTVMDEAALWAEGMDKAV